MDEDKPRSNPRDQLTAAEQRAQQKPFEWRGTKPPGLIMDAQPYVRESVGWEVAIRVMNGVKWRGIVRKVDDDGKITLKPAQELLYDEAKVPQLEVKEIAKDDVLWLRRLQKNGELPPLAAMQAREAAEAAAAAEPDKEVDIDPIRNDKP